MATDELKQHVNSDEDFYSILGVSSISTDSELRTAYRKTALKYHPDKVGASAEALAKFHLVQKAYGLLSDPQLKDQYDNARRAKEQKQQRDQLFEGSRRKLKDELEAREREHYKRKRGEEEEGDAYQRELTRLAADGKRRREKFAERKRVEREAEAEAEADADAEVAAQSETLQNEPGQLDPVLRSIKLRFARTDETSHLTQKSVQDLFSRFGIIEDVVLKEKKVKVDGVKHRKEYITGLIVYSSIVGAHAAVSDFPDLEDPAYAHFEEIGWASGSVPPQVPEDPKPVDADTGSKVPSFKSFKKVKSGVSSHEVTMMRLKNASKRQAEQRAMERKVIDNDP